MPSLCLPRDANVLIIPAKRRCVFMAVGAGPELLALLPGSISVDDRVTGIMRIGTGSARGVGILWRRLAMRHQTGRW